MVQRTAERLMSLAQLRSAGKPLPFLMETCSFQKQENSPCCKNKEEQFWNDFQEELPPPPKKNCSEGGHDISLNSEVEIDFMVVS
jgi:hypothetical protein